ncbi:isocitrate/isopropylmalate family dehydrogenase [uncultured Corynebacterium sp.]|uniref:isocitrate/isopropylmalate family dehydrogenase n=1 Tax=uncultured Corynebacterium sp. TaxID=159447 RepID=UPI0025D59DAF|nr:isocitrate/isopropylmalate family dehydrogenase [uncultured Corynebacterium sp.]
MTDLTAPSVHTEPSVTHRSIRLGYWDGEGIGPEITPPTRRAVDLALLPDAVTVDWMPLLLGAGAFAETGQVVPEKTADTLSGLDGWILGPHDNVSYPPEARAQRNPSAELRLSADLWANVRPVRALPGSVTPELDVVVVRENTEGMYADRNMYAGSGDLRVTADVALAVGVFTRAKVRRITEYAAAVALDRGGVLTVAHKSNVLTRTSGMYLEEAEKVAASTGVVLRPVHIDALCADLVSRPAEHRTIVAENMFGDILSDLTAALGGSLGTAGSVNAGGRRAMAQAAHGSAPDIAGRGVANPAGLMNSAAQLLRHLGYRAAGGRLSAAVREAMLGHPTADVAGVVDGRERAGAPASTTEYSEAVFALLAGPGVGY